MGGGRGLRGQRWGAGNRGGYINPCIARDRAPALPGWRAQWIHPPSLVFLGDQQSLESSLHGIHPAWQLMDRVPQQR